LYSLSGSLITNALTLSIIIELKTLPPFCIDRFPKTGPTTEHFKPLTVMHLFGNFNRKSKQECQSTASSQMTWYKGNSLSYTSTQRASCKWLSTMITCFGPQWSSCVSVWSYRRDKLQSGVIQIDTPTGPWPNPRNSMLCGHQIRIRTGDILPASKVNLYK
jgi:hypothetical protein